MSKGKEHNRTRWLLYSYIGSCRWMQTKLSAIAQNPEMSLVTKTIVDEMHLCNDRLKSSITKDIAAFNKRTKV